MVWGWAPHLESRPGMIQAYILVMALAIAYVAYLSPSRIHHDPPALRGLGTARTGFVRTDNLRESLVPYGLLTLAGTLLLLGLALAGDASAPSRILERPFWVKLSFYLLSALGQQLFFGSFLILRLRALFNAMPGATVRHPLRTRALICGTTALVFAVCHIPNLPMMGFAVALSFSLGWIFYTRPNLLLAVLCHAWLGTLLNRVVLFPMRVGPFYGQPENYVYRILFPDLHRWLSTFF